HWVPFLYCPITELDAREMIQEIRGYHLLTGFRGSPQADVEAIVSTLVNISAMADILSAKAPELDINPLMVLPKNQGVKAVDVLLTFGH
ncbi:CoA-binding protein, partial [SAR202 cluster bacterium AD-804-J14_MRT_500m]|nr:CoA-binding protein [SAR202 cluster bacterium AD-804-J14_MRT_500m]